jgi:hypothetical protein
MKRKVQRLDLITIQSVAVLLWMYLGMIKNFITGNY